MQTFLSSGFFFKIAIYDQATRVRSKTNLVPRAFPFEMKSPGNEVEAELKAGNGIIHQKLPIFDKISFIKAQRSYYLGTVLLGTEGFRTCDSCSPKTFK